MLTVSRYGTMSDLELLYGENIEGGMAETFFKAMYFEMLEVIVETLNNEKHIRIIDRLDDVFSMREIEPNVRFSFFDYLLGIVEGFRIKLLMFKIPNYVKFKTSLQHKDKLFTEDQIVIDFDATFISYTAQYGQEVKADIITDTPTLEQLNTIFGHKEEYKY